MKIRVTIDVDKADDRLNEWSHEHDSYHNGIFGCDKDGIFHMYYKMRNDILEFEDVEVVGEKMYEMCSCGHLGGENCSDLSDASVFRGHANLIEEGHGKCNQCNRKKTIVAPTPGPVLGWVPRRHRHCNVVQRAGGQGARVADGDG